jgi:hypothetical protein
MSLKANIDTILFGASAEQSSLTVAKNIFVGVPEILTTSST